MKKTSDLNFQSELDPLLHSALSSIPESERYFIALSGGLDSVALLTLSLPYLRQFSDQIHVIHVHHGLSVNANYWAEFCAKLANQLGVHFHLEKVAVKNIGKGVEAAARKARYDVFESYLTSGGVLLQGHHLNDQAETVLMRVLKGLGPEAIKGMPQSRSIGSGLLFRPFLHVPRAILEKTVINAHQAWIEDESNQDRHFDRNYIRHEILPLLVKRRSSVIEDLASCARKSKELDEFAKEWFQEEKSELLSHKYALEKALRIERLFHYSELRRRIALRQWFDSLGVLQPTQGTFDRIFSELLLSRKDAKAQVCFDSNTLRVFDGCLFCLPSVLAQDISIKDFPDLEIEMSQLSTAVSLVLPSGKLYIESMGSKQFSKCQTNFEGLGLSVKYILCCIPHEAKSIRLTYRKGGERINLKSEYSSELKKIYQSEKVLPWWRDKYPLVYCGAELIASMAGFQAYHSQPNFECVDQAESPNLLVLRFEPNPIYNL